MRFFEVIISLLIGFGAFTKDGDDDERHISDDVDTVVMFFIVTDSVFCIL